MEDWKIQYILYNEEEDILNILYNEFIDYEDKNIEVPTREEEEISFANEMDIDNDAEFDYELSLGSGHWDSNCGSPHWIQESNQGIFNDLNVLNSERYELDNVLNYIENDQEDDYEQIFNDIIKEEYDMDMERFNLLC